MNDIAVIMATVAIALGGINMIFTSIAMRSVLKRDETLMRLQDAVYRQLQVQTENTKNPKKDKK